MTLTGTVNRVRKGTYAFIRVAPSEEYFAHKKEFLPRDLMKEGQRVRFIPVPTSRGKQAFHIEAA